MSLRIPNSIFGDDETIQPSAVRVPDVLRLAVRDVNNDGFPEVRLCGKYAGYPARSMAIYGFRQRDRASKEVECFDLLYECDAMGEIHVSEGGTIVCPYGSRGYAHVHSWNGNDFTVNEAWLGDLWRIER